jgi:hypothetical protein
MEVTQETIEEWKAKHGFVYRLTLDGKDFYFKPLSRDDYMTVQQKVATEGVGFDNELEVVKICLLDPILEEPELKARAGLITILSEKIMLRSGFQAVEEVEL